MSQNISNELVKEIRCYVKKYNSKIDTANKLGLSYDIVLFYTKDIRINRKNIRKNLSEEEPQIKPYIRTYEKYRSIRGKSLDLLKELVKNGYAFSSKEYGQKQYIKLKKDFPNIRRTKMHGKMIYFLDDKSNIAANAFLNTINKKVMSYQELKQIAKVFDNKFEKED